MTHTACDAAARRCARPWKTVPAWNITTTIALAIYKVTSGLLAGSGALLASGAHSFAAGVGSTSHALGARISSRPPDAAHSHGHGKAQLIAALLAHVLLVLLAIGIAVAATLGWFGRGTRLPVRLAGAAGALIAAASDLHLLHYVRCAAARSRSAQIDSSALANRAVVVSSVSCVFGIAGGLLIHPWLERVAGVVVGAVLAWASVLELKHVAFGLMDPALDPETQAHIAAVARRHPGVREVKGVTSRQIGARFAVAVAVRVAPETPVPRAHAIAVAVRAELAADERLEQVAILVSPAEPASRA